MSEYWVSKKQYWCKYCNIWIRDDAPSRSLHESGLKHQGNKERYIRDIYRSGERTKREKETNAKEFARIEAAAKAAHAKDTGVYSGRPVPDAGSSAAASSSRIRAKPSGDKWANYSSASQLGFDDEETKLSSYEIEQMVRGRGTAVGKWEAVAEGPAMVYGEDGVPSTAQPEPLADLRTDEQGDDHENFKFSHKGKRPVHDVYDDDEWDPAALGSIKFKTKERKIGEAEPKAPVEAEAKKGSAGWSKIGEQVREEVKAEDGGNGKEEAKEEVKEEAQEDVKTEALDTPVKAGLPTEAPAAEVKAEPEAAPAPAASMFKKRRPPPSSRKR